MPKTNDQESAPESAPKSEAKPTKGSPKSRAEHIEEDARKRVAASLGALTLDDARAAAAAQLDADEVAKK